MLAHDDMEGRLRDLHDAYVWEINAAVGEGREDLVRQLADDYLGEAMHLMSELYDGACERSECAVCGRAAVVERPVARRHRWWRGLFRA